MSSTPRKDAANRSSNVALANCLVLAEFDIDKGACVRTFYPRFTSGTAAAANSSSAGAVSSKIKSSGVNVMAEEEYFAIHMLPDGAEKSAVSRTVFVVNRPDPPLYARFPAYCFTPETSAGEGVSPKQFSSGGGSAVSWVRTAGGGASSPSHSELILINKKDASLFIRRKEEVLLDTSECTEDNFNALPTLPEAAKALVKVLDQQASKSGGLTTSKTDVGKPSAASTMNSGYIFTELHGAERPLGLLMRSFHFESMLETLQAARKPDTPLLLPLAAHDEEPPHAVIVTAEEEAAAVSAGLNAGEQMNGGGHHEGQDYLVDAAAPHGGSALQTGEPTHEAASSTGHETVVAPPTAEVEHRPPTPPQQVPLQTEAAEASPPSNPDIRNGEAISPPPSPSRSAGDADLHTSAKAKEDEAIVEASSNVPSSSSSSSSSAGDAPARSPSASSASSAAHALPTAVEQPPSPASSRSAANVSGPLEAKRTSSNVSRSASTEANMGETSGAAASAAQPKATGAARPALAKQSSGEVLFGLCAVVSKKDSQARRGGITKSVAVLGPSLVWLEPFFPILVEAAQYCCDIPGSDADAVKQQTSVLKVCMDSINAAAPQVATAMAKLSRLSTEVRKFSTLEGGLQTHITYRAAPFGTAQRMQISVSPASLDIHFSRYSLESLIELFGPSFMHLVTGVLTEQNIVVLSRQGQPTDVCEAALALGLLGNVVHKDFLAQKVFPYASVNSIESFIRIPGYIIGTLNPIFANEKVWRWDILCDLDQKSIVLASAGSKPSAFSFMTNFSSATAGLASAVGVDTGDENAFNTKGLSPQAAQFFKHLVANILHMRALRLPETARTRRILLILEEYLHTLLMVGFVSNGGGAVPGPLREVFMSSTMNTLRLQCELTSMMDQMKSSILFPQEAPELLLTCAALRRCGGSYSNTDPSIVLALLDAIKNMMRSDEDVLHVLRRMPVAVGGLNPIGIQLTYPSAAVRAAALALLSRIESVAEGKLSISAMSNFIIMMYGDALKTSTKAKMLS